MSGAYPADMTVRELDRPSQPPSQWSELSGQTKAEWAEQFACDFADDIAAHLSRGDDAALTELRWLWRDFLKVKLNRMQREWRSHAH